MPPVQREQRRSSKQNAALHLYCTWLANELNGAGLDMRVVLKPEIAIPWTMQSVKDSLWRPIQRALVHKQSTTNITGKDLNDVFDTLNRHLGERFGLHIPFPSMEALVTEELVRLEAEQRRLKRSVSDK